jgi:hypothetical protein
MLTDTGDSFTIVLNSANTGQNIQAIDSNGDKKYFNCLPSFYSEQAKMKKYKISVNLVTPITPESTLAGAPLYLLDLGTGNNIQTFYQTGSACTLTNSVLIPLEPWVSIASASAIVSTYWVAKSCFTGRMTTDVIQVRIRNASNFAIQNAFPNYILQISFEEVLETKTF